MSEKNPRSIRAAKWSIVGIAVFVVGVVGAVGLNTVLTQHTPPVAVPPGLVGCDPLEASVNLTWNYATFSCGPSTPGIQTNANGTYTPIFNLSGSFYSDLYIYPEFVPNSTSCGSLEGAIQLSNGTGVWLQPGTAWNYCADYTITNVSIAPLGIVWSQ